MPKISIIIPVFNGENYIEKCLKTVINQTLRDIEIIIINDGSTDESIKVINKYKDMDNRIIVINQKNSGQSVARNNGIKRASGEYIGFVDADDWIRTDMYENMYKLAKENNADVVVCAHDKVFDKAENNITNVHNVKSEIINLNGENYEEYIMNYIRNFRHGNEVWNRIFKLDVLRKGDVVFDVHYKQGIPEIGEDMVFNIKAALSSKIIVSTSESYYYYYMREGSAMNSSKPNLLYRMILMQKKMEEYITNKFQEDMSILMSRMLVSIIKEAYYMYSHDNKIHEFYAIWSEVKNDEFVKKYLKIGKKIKHKKEKITLLLIQLNLFNCINLISSLKNKKLP